MIGEIPEVLALSDSGKTVLAKDRFKNASEVRELCQSMIKADRPRSEERSIVDRIANGNPTYSLAALKAKKQAWRARTNHRGLEGLLQQTGNTFYDLNVEVDPCVRVFLDYGKGQDREEWQECIAKNYSRMILQQWPSFDFHVPMRDSNMLRHGLGAHVWPIKGKWEPHTPASGQILFPEDSSVDFHNKGESFLLREFVPAHILYGYIKKEKAATSEGWNIKAVWNTLKQSSKTSRPRESPEEFEKSLRNADYGTSMNRQAGVWLNYLFNIEIDTRKISQYIVPELIDSGTDYLFKKRNRFDSFEDLLVIFPYEIPSTGVLHSIRGLGARSREHFDLLNRIYNAMADNVLLSMYPQFKQTGQTDPDKMRLMRIGAMTIYPQNVEPSILNLPNLAQGGIPLSQILTNSVNENNQTYLQGTPEPRDRETALSFGMRAQDSARVSKATHSLYYRNLTRFHKKILLTAVKPNYSNEPWAVLARDMRDRCIKDGVPAAAFSHIADVEAMRSVGAGSASAKLQALDMLLKTIYPTTTEDRKIAIERDFTSALVGYAQVDRYARNAKDRDIPNNDDSIAALENDAMLTGGEAVMNSAQDHVKHANSHLQKAGEIVMAVKEGQMDPEQALAALQALGQHVAEHLAQLEGNPLRQAEYEQLQKEWLALSKIADQLLQQVEEMRDSEQPDPMAQVSDQLQIGLAKVDADSQVKQAKFQRDAAIKDAKFANDTRLKFGQAAATTRLAAVKTAAEIQHKRLALTNGSKAKT